MFYFVATPIGNLKDFSLRAIEILKEADLILCEDTRTSLKLLYHYELNKPLDSFHKFNYREKTPFVISELKKGKNLCLISDAGTPCISDPGQELISAFKENKIKYSIIPGACAFVNAFALSGFETPLTFVGFLPNNKKERRDLLSNLKTYKSTLAFYSATHSIFDDLQEFYEEFGNREVCIVRELTKMFEEIVFFNLAEKLNFEQKGEFVVLIKGADTLSNELNNLSIMEHYNYYINIKLAPNDAIKQVAKDRRLPKNQIYNEIVKLKNNK